MTQWVMKSSLGWQWTELSLWTSHKYPGREWVKGKPEWYSPLQPETTFSKWETRRVEQDNAYQDAVKYRGEQFKRGMTSVSKQSKGAESACRISSEARVTRNGKISQERGVALDVMLWDLTATSWPAGPLPRRYLGTCRWGQIAAWAKQPLCNAEICTLLSSLYSCSLHLYMPDTVISGR